MLFLALVALWLAPLLLVVRVLVKNLLFYLYLWQLKEYHIGRFFDHFRTDQGKRLLWNRVFAAKIILALALVTSLIYIYFIHPKGGVLLERASISIGLLGGIFFFVLYLLEVRKIATDIRSKRLRLPVFTRKTLFLTGINVLVLVSLTYAVHKGALFLSSLTWTYDFFASIFLFFLGFLLLDLFFPLIVSAIVLAFQPFAVVARNRVIQKARVRRKKFKNLKVVGITGSYGKTSTKEFLAHILGQKYAVLKTPEHQNSEVGIANTILRSLTDEHDVFVCEMGAYNKGGIKLLADITKPDIGIVAGVNEQHLATFGSMESLLSAEGGEELVRSLPKNGVAIVNGKSSKLKEHIPNLEKANKNVKFVVGTKDLRAENVRIEKEEISFEVDDVKFLVPTYGGHNVENLLLTIAAAKEIGMSLVEIAKAAETMPLEMSALQVKKGANGVTIIDSTYSANPDGVIVDLDYLSLYEGKKIVVMPCLIELGIASKKVHKRIGEKIGEVCDLAMITTEECFQDIKEGAKEKEVLLIKNSKDIVKKIEETTKDREGTVLLEGGKESAVQRQLMRSLVERSS